jgi:hypothetical protein
LTHHATDVLRQLSNKGAGGDEATRFVGVVNQRGVATHERADPVIFRGRLLGVGGQLVGEHLEGVWGRSVEGEGSGWLGRVVELVRLVLSWCGRPGGSGKGKQVGLTYRICERGATSVALSATLTFTECDGAANWARTT